MITQTPSTVGVAEAKNKLSELIDRVGRGEEITITRHDRAIARLVPAQRRSQKDIRQTIAEIRALRAQVVPLTVKAILRLKNAGRP
jgi:prevent-host-death family protein